MQARQLWQAVLGDMQVRLSRSAFDNWLRPTTIVGFADDVATVAAANTFGASTLQARYAADIERVMSDIVGRPIRVEFTVIRSEVDTGPTEPIETADDGPVLTPRARETAALVASAGRPLPGGIPLPAGRERSQRRAPDGPRRANPTIVAQAPKRSAPAATQ